MKPGADGNVRVSRLPKHLANMPVAAPIPTAYNRIVALRAAGQTIKQTADLTGCSLCQVMRIWAMHLATARPAEG